MQPDANSRAMVQDYLLQSAAVKCQVAEQCLPSIIAAAPTMAETFRTGGKVLLCGNGGSAADCQHLATECVSRLTEDVARPGLPAFACTTDTSFLTAFANDCGFEGVLARQVQALGKPGDVLIGISTSGNSTHVLRAIEAATVGHLRTVALTGSGGRLAHMVTLLLQSPVPIPNPCKRPSSPLRTSCALSSSSTCSPRYPVQHPEPDDECSGLYRGACLYRTCGNV